MSFLDKCAPTSIRHGKTTFFTIGGHIQTHIILRLFPSRPLVPGRKNRANKCYYGNCLTGVWFNSINIPPCISVWWYVYIKIRLAFISSTASSADSVAIGTPAPGCIPPPTRNRLATEVTLLGRWKVDIIPCGLCP